MNKTGRRELKPSRLFFQRLGITIFRWKKTKLKNFVQISFYERRAQKTPFYSNEFEGFFFASAACVFFAFAVKMVKKSMFTTVLNFHSGKSFWEACLLLCLFFLPYLAFRKSDPSSPSLVFALLGMDFLAMPCHVCVLYV